MVEVDPAFIQVTEHRPKQTALVVEEIPIIDLSLSTHGDHVTALVSEIGNACKEWGFFQVINHGVPLELCQEIQKMAKLFFDQSMEEKSKLRRDEVHPMGYYDSEHTKNVRDWKEVFDFVVQEPVLMPASHDPQDKELTMLTNQWPQYPPHFRETCEEYAREVEKLAYKLLELISMSLGLAAKRLNGFFKDQTTFVRLNHYPPCPFPDLALGVGRHKDGGALTVLAQDDVGGLEVRRKSDGEWIQVKPTPNAFIINVGDIIQVWSNDKYESVEHRAMVNTEKKRFSIPFFFNPGHCVAVKPLEELIDEHNLPKYREYTWGKFYATRNRSDFKKLDVENIQISDFRIQD